MAVPADLNKVYAIPGYIPTGITPGYLAESRDRAAIIAIIFIGLFAVLLALLRIYARTVIIKGFGVDDGLALLTPIYVAFMVLCIVLINLGSGRHIEYIQYILTNDQTNRTEVLDFVAHLLYTTALFVCRLSGLAFYRRIVGKGNRKLTITTWVATGFLIAAYLPQMFLLIFHCIPVTGLWPYAWQAEVNNFTCLQWGVVYSVNSSVSLVCDLILFVIPAIIISRLKVNSTRKMILSLILFPGVLVIIISCVRLDLVIKGQWETDQAWWYDPMLAVENAEIGGTLIALSVPGLKPLFKRWLSNVNLSFLKSQPNPTSISLRSKPKSQGDHRFGGVDRYERAASDVSVPVAKNIESADSLRKADRGGFPAAMLARRDEWTS